MTSTQEAYQEQLHRERIKRINDYLLGREGKVPPGVFKSIIEVAGFTVVTVGGLQDYYSNNAAFGILNFISLGIYGASIDAGLKKAGILTWTQIQNHPNTY